jgi:hypothetical protein
MYLKEGVKLQSVWFDEGREGYCLDMKSCPIESITVSMEKGHLERVPWARIVHKDGRVCMLNLAHCIEVGLLEQEAGENE